MITNVRELIEKHEGRVPYAYQDSLGYWTIGVGHLIDIHRGGSIPDHIIDQLLDYDIQAKAAELAQATPWLNQLDEVRRAALLDMSFNLGVAGLMKWPIFLNQVKTGQYAAAAKNMLSTKWASQVKGRAVRLAQMMESGAWPS